MRLDKIRAKLWPARMDQRMQIRWDSVAIFFSPICWPIPLLVSGSVLDQEQPTTHPTSITLAFEKILGMDRLIYTVVFWSTSFFGATALYTRLKPITIRQKKIYFCLIFFFVLLFKPTFIFVWSELWSKTINWDRSFFCQNWAGSILDIYIFRLDWANLVVGVNNV